MITVAVSTGELIDKITILEIKRDRIGDDAKRANVERELALLMTVRDQELGPSAELAALADALRVVNARLWDIEDEIRGCERAGDFGARFIALARAVYRENDQRAAVKRQINEFCGSQLIEEKSYAEY